LVLGIGNIDSLPYHLPLVVAVGIVVAAVVVGIVVGIVVAAIVVGIVVAATVDVGTVSVSVVVVVAALRAKITPNGMQMVAAARTLMTIQKIIQNSLCLFFPFSLCFSSHTNLGIVLVSFQFAFFNH
jgi:hypothetical protein